MLANAVAREKVVAILNFMTLDLLPLFFNTSNFQVVRLTSYLSSGTTSNVSKDTSAVVEAADDATIIENLQLSSYAPPLVVHDVAIVQADSPPRKSLEPSEEVGEPM